MLNLVIKWLTGRTSSVEPYELMDSRETSGARPKVHNTNEKDVIIKIRKDGFDDQNLATERELIPGDVGVQINFSFSLIQLSNMTSSSVTGF